MQFLQDNTQEEREDILSFFDITLSHMYILSCKTIVTIRRLPPSFPPVIWNVHSNSLSRKARSNNVLCNMEFFI